MVAFKSLDGLTITADYYPLKKPKGLILLCHRSHCNRGEYRETAPKFNDLGFSCLAIDQRSGMKIFGVVNETKTLAKQKGLATGYLDARQDIEAGIDYAYKLNRKIPIIVLGSSYSASLALLIAAASEKVASVIAFSPVECLKNTSVSEGIANLSKPIFITSAKKEVEDTSQLIGFVNPKYVHHFKPDTDGFHGSKALWESVDGYESYWQALNVFLSDKAKI